MIVLGRLKTLLLSATLCAALVSTLNATSVQASDLTLEPVARVGPWPAVSKLIGFDGRLWFANSVKFRNHNSADLYSYDPETGKTRYERHLFSQDAGQPTVLDGRLYWPFEDARASAGHGEFMVTDHSGRWDWRMLPEGLAFHLHVMLAEGSALYATPSAWQALIERSDDGGVTWRVVYEQPTPKGMVSRITSLAALDGVLYAGLTERGTDGAKLLRQGEAGFEPVAQWPTGRATVALAAFDGRIYGVNYDDNGSAVWRTDGHVVERVTALDGEKVRGFAAGPDHLWAVSERESDGTLWRSANGLHWQAVQHFAGAIPLDVTLFGGKPYVGTLGPDNVGTLWGPAAPAPAERAAPPVSPLPEPRDDIAVQNVDKTLTTLDRELAEPGSYGHQFAALVTPLARSKRPEIGVGLSERVAGPFPDSHIEMFGGAVTMPAARIARWYLLWATAMNGHGRINTALLDEKWTSPTNRAEKYFAPAPLAAWAAARLGQNDPATLAALIARLSRDDDPPWLTGDFIGALTALTGQHFGYDRKAWGAWWRECRKKSEQQADATKLASCRTASKAPSGDS